MKNEDTKKDPLTVEDLVVIEKAVMNMGKEDPRAWLAGMVDLITATLTKKGTFKAKGDLAKIVASEWRSWEQRHKTYWLLPERNNTLFPGYPKPPHIPEDPIAICWWNRQWMAIERVHREFLEKKEVSRNLKF